MTLLLVVAPSTIDGGGRGAVVCYNRGLIAGGGGEPKDNRWTEASNTKNFQ